MIPDRPGSPGKNERFEQLWQEEGGMSELLRLDEEERNLPHLTLDGERVPFLPGETLYQVAERHGREIPTLCYDPRLEAFGGCRLCVVEVEGWGSRWPPAPPGLRTGWW